MGKLERRFLGRLGALADRLLAGWLLLGGLAEVPEGEAGSVSACEQKHNRTTKWTSSYPQ